MATGILSFLEMRTLAIVAALVTLLVAGCSHGSDASLDGGGVANKGKKEKPPDPTEIARSGMHEGAFLLGNAADDLQKGLSAGKSLQASTKNIELKAALADVLEKLDDAGGSIADYTAEPPELTEFKKGLAAQDKRRLESIVRANDALHQVNESNDLLDDFTDKPAPEDDQTLADLTDALDAAAADLADAIKALGRES